MFYQILAFITRGKTQDAHARAINLKISALTWNVEFELPDGSYSVSDIRDYFEYILKTRGRY